MDAPFPVIENKLLSSLSTFGIGGPAKYFFEARSTEQLQEAIIYCSKKKMRYMILGKGSNCLFDSRGFNGLIIANRIDFLKQEKEGLFHAGAGYSFSLLGSQTARWGYSGLEFASGIPGSVGGAVFMNAGANGKEACETLCMVEYIDEEGCLHVLKKEDIHFSYRSSSFQTMRGAIAGASFELILSKDAREKQLNIIAYRKKTQPYGEMSAGCVFRNPSCGHAGALIEQCGLKTVSIGGAKISPIHANFIVNEGNATSDDVLALIDRVKEKVRLEKGIELISEIRCIPFDGENNE